MIDEATLTGLLADHAGRIPVPSDGIDALLAASPQGDRSSGARPRTRPSARVLAAAAIIVVATGSLWAYTDHAREMPTVGRAAVATKDAPRSPVEASPPTSAAPATPPNRLGGQSLEYNNTSGLFTTGTTDAFTPDATKSHAAVSTRIVRTGTLDLRIAQHSFGTTMGRITTIAAAAGGFVADAKTYESATTPSGTATLRIPSARFNPTVEKVRALGTVVTASTRGEDVTGQYTDLNARLRAATATRTQYLTVLQKATNIGDILAVQDRIEAVQTQIEQLQAQLSQLGNQTTYATLTISVNEPAPKARVAVAPHQSGVSKAWDNARDGFARRVEGIISHSGSALVLLVTLLLAAGALRLLIPRVRRLLV